MSIVGAAKYETSVTPVTANGKIVQQKSDDVGNLLVRLRPTFPEAWNLNYGTGSTYGKASGTVANAAKLYIALDCTDVPISEVDWAITSDQQYTYRLFRSHQNELSGTLTFADDTAVEGDDTFVLNGLTYTFKEGANVVASRYIGLGANNAAAAVNTAAMLLNATYGVPGLLTASITSPSTTDVITLSCDDATALQFGQGTSAANEVAWSDTTLTGLWADGAVSSNVAATTGTRGNIVHQTSVDGWEWCFLQLTNTSGSAAATFEVRAIRH